MLKTLKKLYKIVHIVRRKYRVYIVKKTVKSYKGHIYVGGRTKLTAQTVLGDNVVFNGMTIVGHGPVTMGDNVHTGVDCLLITTNHNYHGEMIPYDKTYVVKSITIEDNIYMGSRVIVLGGVTIGEGAIIQAGALIYKDVPKCAIMGGNPAQVIKYRDEEHYYRLKAEGKFN